MCEVSDHIRDNIECAARAILPKSIVVFAALIEKHGAGILFVKPHGFGATCGIKNFLPLHLIPLFNPRSVRKRANQPIEVFHAFSSIVRCASAMSKLGSWFAAFVSFARISDGIAASRFSLSILAL